MVAEDRGVGVAFPSVRCERAFMGRGMTASSDCAAHRSQADDSIRAERTPIEVQASAAAALLDELERHLAAQPSATLRIRWQLTRPADAR